MNNPFETEDDRISKGLFNKQLDAIKEQNDFLQQKVDLSKSIRGQLDEAKRKRDSIDKEVLANNNITRSTIEEAINKSQNLYRDNNLNNASAQRNVAKETGKAASEAQLRNILASIQASKDASEFDIDTTVKGENLDQQNFLNRFNALNSIAKQTQDAAMQAEEKRRTNRDFGLKIANSLISAITGAIPGISTLGNK